MRVRTGNVGVLLCLGGIYVTSVVLYRHRALVCEYMASLWHGVCGRSAFILAIVMP